MKLLALILAFILWSTQIAGLAVYSGKVWSCRNDFLLNQKGFDSLSTSLLFIAIVTVFWTFAVRLFYKIFLISKGRILPNSTMAWMLFLASGIFIWIPSGAIAIYGLVVFYTTYNLILFGTFMFISLLLLVIHFPLFLIPKTKN